MKNNTILDEALGTIDKNELSTLAKVGGAAQPESASITISSADCIEISIAGATAASAYFSCGKMCK